MTPPALREGPTPPTALAGIRVVEYCSSVAGAYCGRQFALWGAEVMLLEEATSPCPLRTLAPHVGNESLTWEYVAAGKRAATIDSVAPDPERLLTLLGRADVLITDQQQTLHTRWGLDVDALHARLPHLVIVSVSPFGTNGPHSALPASALVIQALSGYAWLNGAADGPPLKAPAHILPYAAGVAAFVGALAALYDAQRTGHGHLVEAAEFDAIASILPLLRSEYTGVHPMREGGPGTGVRAFPCRDGYVTFMPPTPQQRPKFAEVLDIPDDGWPTAEDGADRRARRDQLITFLTECTRTKTKDHVFLGLLERGVVCGKVASPQDVVADAHLTARGFFEPFEHPTLGLLRMPGAPARLSLTPAAASRPAPAQPEVIEIDALGWPTLPVRRNERRDAPASGRRRPLDGVRLLDLTQAWIGPFAAMLLADLGADTIKIEAHRRPDVWRQWSANPVPLANVRAEEINASPNYNSVNRNKRSLCLDLKAPAGRALLLRLVAQSHILMENYTPRVMSRFGLDYDALAAVNPALVMTSFSGYGKTGPLSDYKANGTSIEAMAGWDYFHRYPDGEPMVMGFYQADAISGLQMAATTLVALVHQLRTGQGQAIDGSMYEAAAGYLGEALLDTQCGQQQTCFGNRDPDRVPSGIYPCRGDDRWIALTIEDDAAWQRLVRVADDAGLDDERFATRDARRTAVADIDHLLARWSAHYDAEALAAQLQQAGIAAGTVRTVAEIFACLHLNSRDWFRPIHHPDLGEHRYNGHPWRFERVALPPDLPPPRLGEHGRALLKERLALTDAEIDALEADGITGSVMIKLDAAGTITTDT
jgi:crotonobetainyl-CoA:carnitine CoA-transferase CaiB-like acyl-CoA transferase